ncbi:4Fe-4S dicluster domain-containing protein [Bilophila wadsworthia]|uniref:4Fe-4S dicluster domain-containing protein n=1 Tax=Bilophila wadsworthia TaxID=35833 RepID=UPI003F655755
MKDCPGYILELDKEHDETPHVIEAYKRECWHCGNCRISCPHQAVSFEFPLYTLV